MRQYSRSLFEDMLMIDNGEIPKSHWKVNEPVAPFVSCYFCHLYVVSPKTQVGVIDRSAHTIEPSTRPCSTFTPGKDHNTTTAQNLTEKASGVAIVQMPHWQRCSFLSFKFRIRGHCTVWIVRLPNCHECPEASGLGNLTTVWMVLRTGTVVSPTLATSIDWWTVNWLRQW